MNELKTNERQKNGDTIITIKLEGDHFRKMIHYFLQALYSAESNSIEVDLKSYDYSLPIESTFLLSSVTKIDKFIEYLSTLDGGNLELKITNKDISKDIYISSKLEFNEYYILELKLSDLGYILFSITDAALKKIIKFNDDKEFLACNVYYKISPNDFATPTRYYNFHCSSYTRQPSPHSLLFLNNVDSLLQRFEIFEDNYIDKIRQCNLFCCDLLYKKHYHGYIQLDLELGFGKCVKIPIIFPLVIDKK